MQQSSLFSHLLTIEETSHALGISISTLNRMVARNEIPSIKLGHFRRFSVDALQRYFKEMEERWFAEVGTKVQLPNGLMGVGKQKSRFPMATANRSTPRRGRQPVHD